MIQRDLQEILELEQIGVQLDDLFDEPKMKEFILQIKMSTYQQKMSLSITKLQVLQDNENTIEVPEIYKMVKVKQEKNDDDLDVHFTTKNLSKGKKIVHSGSPIESKGECSQQNVYSSLKTKKILKKNNKNNDDRGLHLDSDMSDTAPIASFKANQKSKRLRKQ
ncbi:hypothetical protein AQUCO_00300310v1 [Aquilegia coerulea]|uniref:Uncharacterized protein n=1 Tax=Aquilegia coerulea TaxID=218851 RepID=A0A2G5EYC1_AQUCA|nr:hypothetical protein AQUCO_00300310v1 [Aquilegia coerulea]